MKRIGFTFIALLVFTLPALAKDVLRVKVPAVGETFYVKLKANSLYLVDPFETLITPETEIVESCVVNMDKSNKQVSPPS